MNECLQIESSLGIKRPAKLNSFVFYEPAGQVLWQTWQTDPNEENQNTFVSYMMPMIKALIYSSPHLYPNHQLTKAIYEVVFNELIITTILLMPKYDPCRGSMHGFFSFKLWRDLWTHCDRLKRFHDVSNSKIDVADLTPVENTEMNDLIMLLTDLLEHAKLEFFELITFEHLLAILLSDHTSIIDLKQKDVNKQHKHIISIINKSCGLQKTLIKQALDKLWQYYTLPESIEKAEYD